MQMHAVLPLYEQSKNTLNSVLGQQYRNIVRESKGRDFMNFMCRLGKMVREVGGRFGIVVGITYQPLPW